MSVPARAARSTPDASTRTSTPAARSLPAAFASARSSARPESTPVTARPRLRSASAAATPERASPTTRYGPGGSGGLGLPTNAEAVHRERDRRAGHGHDPEAQ